MSMICYVGQLNDADLAKVLEHPKRTELLVNEGEYFETVKPTILQRLFGKKNQVQDSWKPEVSVALCDLDKAWHGIHFLLTGDAEGGEFPLNFLMSGGKDLGEDVGYGPLRILFQNEVEELSEKLETLGMHEFEKRFSAPLLIKNEIYPLTSDWSEDNKAWLTETYEELRIYVLEAAKNKASIFVAIV